MGEPDCAERLERVDTGRQVEVLASLFREGLMPRDGVFILEGVAKGHSYGQIAKDLRISKDAVEGRMREMRRICRERMEKLGMVPRMQPLRLVACNPTAMTLLQAAA